MKMGNLGPAKWVEKPNKLQVVKKKRNMQSYQRNTSSDNPHLMGSCLVVALRAAFERRAKWATRFKLSLGS